MRAQPQPAPLEVKALVRHPGAVGNLQSLRLLQRAAGNSAVSEIIKQSALDDPVVQRHCYEQFDNYNDAKVWNDYSLDHLDKQKDDPIGDHHGKEFSSDERDNIFYTNKIYSSDWKIHSDGKDREVLYRQDTDRTPHIDHRYPSSKGGTNSFRNARVMPAAANIRKGAKLEALDREPRYALPQYAGLDDSVYSIGGFRGFNADQKREIYAANKAHYGVGSIVSDVDGVTKLDPFDSTQVAHVDHVLPKSEGGCNYYFNAKVVSAAENIEKGGRRRRFGESDDDERDVDFETGQKTLAQYFKGEGYTEKSEDIEDL